MPPGPVPCHRLRRGLDLPLAGEPEQTAHAAAPVQHVAVLGDDPIGPKPGLLVQPGERVRLGQALFEDKTRPGVRHTAPAAGTVLAVHGGERRAFQSLVIRVEGDDDPAAQQDFASCRGVAAGRLSDGDVRAPLLESGPWTALRTRPFARVPAADASPHAQFITPMHTRPHAPSPQVVPVKRRAEFETGIGCLAKLPCGPTQVRVAADSTLELPAASGATRVAFDRPFPAGTLPAALQDAAAHDFDALRRRTACW